MKEVAVDVAGPELVASPGPRVGGNASGIEACLDKEMSAEPFTTGPRIPGSRVP